MTFTLYCRDELNESFAQFDKEQVEAIYELGDTNGDEVLDMGEFIDIMYPTAGEALSKLSKNYKNIDEVKDLFKKLDVDNDGSITKVELAEGVIRFTPQEVDSIMALGDVNDDGSLDMEEFIGVMYPSAATIASRLRSQYTDINSIKKAFSKIDINQDGMVSKEEVAASGTFNQQEIDALFVLGDANNDGEIDLEEFLGVLYPVVANALVKMTKEGLSISLELTVKYQTLFFCCCWYLSEILDLDLRMSAMLTTRGSSSDRWTTTGTECSARRR